MLTKDQILAANDAATQTVDVPEWGGAIGVIAMNGIARDAFNASVAKGQPQSLFIANLLVATVVDDAGNPVFTVADVDALQKKNAAVTGRIADVAMKLNGLGASATEDAAKNSEAAPSGDSGSDSQPT